MGNRVVSWRGADPAPLDATDNHGPAASVRTAEPTSWNAPNIFRHFALQRFACATAKPASTSEPDAYLLVLLADQELTAGRDDQALCLLEAAYAAFDRKIDGADGAGQRR